MLVKASALWNFKRKDIIHC